MFRSTTRSAGEINGFLDAGSHMKGELHFEDIFRIEGKLTGSVVSEGELIVGDRGEVEGDIRALRIFVSGVVRGTLRAQERVVIAATGKVLADVHTPILTVEEGAVIDGRCYMQSNDESTDDGSSRDKVTQMPGTQKSQKSGAQVSGG